MKTKRFTDEGQILGNQPVVKKDRGICVICKVNLINLTDADPLDEKPDYFILECPQCHKQYYPKYELVPHNESFGSIHEDVNDSLETEGLGSFDGDLLLSDNHDYRSSKTGGAQQLSEGEKQIYRYFGSHVDIVEMIETDPTEE